MEHDGPNASVKCSASWKGGPNGAPTMPAPTENFLSV